MAFRTAAVASTKGVEELLVVFERHQLVTNKSISFIETLTHIDSG